ncbi:FHA domain-containing protein [Aliidiomarina halalkaliphila]|uniref:FHA domain-containing protein n=1 Tax=Aliidiomarina halalkaliphila TaxID=2593535 RepID=A0A552X4H6_9GAMM|nr:GAF domain-containing protein [Aliidiomarina halalkaliphila]TRW49856.1 FHA domain-containing protein [Aliidiomarina halalkaliphila]
MPLRLHMNLVDQPSQVALLMEGRPYVVGRGSSADIHLNHPAVSRSHAQFQFHDGSWQVQDLNSSSGCYVNHERVAQLRLTRDPVQFRMGQVNCVAEWVPYRDAVVSDSQANWQLKQVQNSTPQLMQPMDLDTFANFATEILQNLFPRERAALLLLDEQGELTHSCGNPHWVNTDDFAGSRTAIRRVVETHKPVVLANIQDDRHLRIANSVVQQGINSLICVPVALNQTLYGVLYADSTEVSRPFTEIDLRVVTSYARQLGIVFGLREIDQELANS